MFEAPLAKRRFIGRHRIPSPLLIPSYSSRGFYDLAALVASYSPLTSRRCLVSAYDVFYDALSEGWRDLADFMVLDSGGYEAYASSELSTPRSWSVELYERVVSNLGLNTTYLLVTFDYNRDENPVSEQLHAAIALRRAHPEYDWDFLVKPPNPRSSWVDFEALASRASELGEFSAIGFVEDEIGPSMSTRTQNLARLRRHLSELGFETPIHVFGCLDPLAIPYYFLSGADVFDGLEWLRWAFTDIGLVRVPSLIIQDGHLDQSESDRTAIEVVDNLKKLQAAEMGLRRYLDTRDVESLALPTASKDILRTFASGLSGTG
jgi:hypothetical protein